MLYSEEITALRNEVGDTRRRCHVDWTGDGTTTIFQLPVDCYPVLDQTSPASYIVKVGGSTKTETTDYTLDKEAGTLVLSSAPTNGQAISIDHSAVYITDANWLNIINSVIRSLGNDFFKEFTDITSFVTTANMISLDLAARPKTIAVYSFSFRENSGENFQGVEERTNYRYSREDNTIYLGSRDAFTVAGQVLRVRGLEGYTLGTLVSDTIDVQDRFLTIVEYGAIARYWRWRYKSVVELVSKQTQESTRTALQELIMLADRFDRSYESEKAKLKPQKPVRVIPPYKEGGGNP